MRNSSSTGDSPRLISAPVSLAFDPPPRNAILGPLLAKGTVAHLRGPDGVGKSDLALEIANAVACGHRALTWFAPRPRRVLFLYADMPSHVLRHLKTIRRTTAAPNVSFMTIASPSEPAEHVPRLAGFDLLVYDGRATPRRSESPGRWRRLARAIASWREHGLAVLVISRDAVPALTGMIDVTIGVAGSAIHNGHRPALQRVLIETGDDPDRAFAEASLRRATSRGRWRVFTRDHADLMRISGLTRAGFSTKEIALKLGLPEPHVCQLQAPADRHASAWFGPHPRQSDAAQYSKPRLASTHFTAQGRRS